MPLSYVIEPDNHTQANGRKYVTEIHSDDLGEFARVTYLAPVGADYNAIATARQPRLVESRAQTEATESVDDQTFSSPRFQTVPDMLLRIRERYLNSTGTESCLIAKWIVDNLNAGNINTSQCQTAWGVNPAEWNNINGTMDTYAAAIESVDSAVGE